jgi:hypothetical protein
MLILCKSTLDVLNRGHSAVSQVQQFYSLPQADIKDRFDFSSDEFDGLFALLHIAS